MKRSLSILCGLFLFGIIAATAQEKTAKPGTKDAKGEADATIGLVTFSQLFISNEDKQDFQKLRRFLYRQQELLKEFHAEKEEYYWTYNEHIYNQQKEDNARIEEFYKELTNQTSKNDNGREYVVCPRDFNFYSNYFDQYVSYYQGDPIVLDDFKNGVMDVHVDYMNSLIEAKMKSEIVEKKIEITENNIYACEEQLSETLAPEYKRQEFRRSVSLNFTILIGVLLLGFFSIIYLKSDKSIGKEFLSLQTCMCVRQVCIFPYHSCLCCQNLSHHFLSLLGQQ